MAERGFSLVEALVAVSIVALGTLALAGATLSALQAARTAGASARLAAAASAGIEVTRAIAATAAAAAPDRRPDEATLAWRSAWVARWQATAALAPWPLRVTADWSAEGGATVTATLRDGDATLRFDVVAVLPPADATP